MRPLLSHRHVGSLHDAVEGMHAWNSVVLALFFTSLFLLQLSAFSFMYGHSSLSVSAHASLAPRGQPAPPNAHLPVSNLWQLLQRICTMLAVFSSIATSIHYARLIIKRLRVPKDVRVTGAFFCDGRYALDGFSDGTTTAASIEASLRAEGGAGGGALRGFGSDSFINGAPGGGNGRGGDALCSSRAPSVPGGYATRIAGDEKRPLTAEAVDAALRRVRLGNVAVTEGELTPSRVEAAVADAGGVVSGGVYGHSEGGGGEGGGGEESGEEEDAPLRGRQRASGRHEAWRRQAARSAEEARRGAGAGGGRARSEAVGLLAAADEDWAEDGAEVATSGRARSSDRRAVRARQRHGPSGARGGGGGGGAMDVVRRLLGGGPK